MDPVYQHLVTTLTTKFEVPPDRVSPQATLGDLELDSLALVELYVTLQDHWKIPLDDSTAKPELTLHQVTQAVKNLQDEHGDAHESA
ncbi:acyl carrier protein [Streptomyces mauvecolor]|uniref:Acyl carrier protein n=1 Tax=Streptomyces mauvecolor TaxID=58345 RepID=A0ABV9UYJ9_9ACTN